MIELLLRLTLLLLSSAFLIFALQRAEPTWRLVVARSAFFAALLMIGFMVAGPKLQLPVWKAAAPVNPSTSSIQEWNSGPETAPQSTESAAQVSQVQPQFFPSLPVTLGSLWAMVTIVLLLRQTVGLAQVANSSKTMKPASQSVHELWWHVCEEIEVQPSRVLLAEHNCTPHLSFNGDLILPQDVTESQTPSSALVHVLRHEAAHLQAKDHRWFPFISALTNLLWFHPLAWWLNALHLQACEDARDAAAARQGGVDAYRATIAQFALRWIPVRSGTPSFFRKGSGLKRRLNGVGKTVRQRPVSRIQTLLPCVTLLGFGLLIGGVVLVPKSSIAETSSNQGLLGSWRALNPGSDYLKQIDIVEEGGTVLMKIWHSQGNTIGKSPSLIRIPAQVEQIRQASTNSPAIETSKDFGFKTEFYQLKLTEKALVLTSSVRYTDNSGRAARTGDYYFLPGTYAEAQVDHLGTTGNQQSQGWLGYWKNKDRGSRGTLQLRFHDAGDITFSVWGSQGNEISKSPISRATFPLSREEALAGKPTDEPIQVTVDHGFCQTTYALELTNSETILLNVSTDYVDPKRSDQEHLWVFEPGKF
ncbi:MAG: M56 family metallopeptidase [Verrucomicrobiota bacterium]